jgi:pyruvate,orthophosphate dikinase
MVSVYAFDDPHGITHREVVDLLGGKAANLSVMAAELGMPVPPGFAVCTAACREYLAAGWPDGLDAEIAAHLGRVESAVGRTFGSGPHPLLVSVRSGAPVSMPGMMDTILNPGINDEVEAALAAEAGDPEFAAACRRRFVEMFRDVVGVEDVPTDPFVQLRMAVEAVFRSWNSDRARAYRAREGIPDDMGTAVTVQTMVFGNLGEDSGTGVLFTRNPATGDDSRYGDVLFSAQGEDVVAGTHQTEPIAVLDERMPDVAAQLWSNADILERHYADMLDIEFTIERGVLWMLQVRTGKRTPQAALRIAIDMAEDEGFPLTRTEAVRRMAEILADPPTVPAETGEERVVLTEGLGVSPGVASGAIVTSPDEAVARADRGDAVVLVRRETSPDDVHGMAVAKGILTSTGGFASHAAVVARGWGIPAVVGAAEVEVDGGGATIAGRRLDVGEVVSIDGSTGEVMFGAVGGETRVMPEAGTLLGWAEELGIDVSPASEGSEGVAEADAGSTRAADPEMVIRALAIKGFATTEAVSSFVRSSVENAAGVLEGLVADGTAEPTGPMFKLSDAGKEQASALISADREAWGSEAAEAGLDGFIPLDQRMKVVVTAWQMRQVDGEPVMNDHEDEEYDAGVLADFAALAADAGEWIAPLAAGLARLDAYRVRLEQAAAKVAGGDHEYIASPRIDSYHNVWFELHEDLILLAGRTREAEVEAGRA